MRGMMGVFKLKEGQFFEERRVCPPQMRVTSGMSTPKGRRQRFASVPAGCALYLPTDRLKADLGWPPEGFQLFLCRSL